jgi:MFS family permease
MRVPGYPVLLAGSFLWHVSRWAALFSVSYLLTQLAHSPFLNQAVGALIYLPMFAGGLTAGVIVSRFDRRLLVLRLQLAQIPAELAMFALVVFGHVEIWMTVPYTLLVGCGNLVNMTAQRAFLYDAVGPEHARPAMTLETAAQACAIVVGTLGYGALIDAFGIRAAFAASAVILIGSRGLLASVRPARRPPAAGTAPSFTGQLRASWNLVRRSAVLRGLIAVTIVMNFFSFGYQPLVPLISERFSGDALTAGTLASAPAVGMVLGGLALASRPVARRGLLLVAGSACFGVCVIGFAVAPSAGLAAGFLLCAGVGQSGFNAMQAVMSTDGLAEQERGVALGAVASAIGAMQPLGMVQLGVASELAGPRAALAGSAAAGLVFVAGIAWRWSRSRGPGRSRPAETGALPACETAGPPC